MNAEPIRVAVGPLKIVHQTPQKVAAHRHALGSCATQLRQVTTQERNAIRVVDAPVSSRLVRSGTTVLSNIDLLDIPKLRDVTRSPVKRFGRDEQPRAGGR